MKPADPQLYARCKAKAKRSYERWPSAYGSAALAKCYRNAGGTYEDGSNTKGRKGGKRSPRRGGVAKWMREEWVQVRPYLSEGKVVACGAKKDAAKACRPLRRVDGKTPPTLPELLKLHSKATLLSLAKQKRDDMDGRVYWKRGVFVPSA